MSVKKVPTEFILSFRKTFLTRFAKSMESSDGTLKSVIMKVKDKLLIKSKF